MKREKQDLLHDLIGDPARRDFILAAGGRALRRRRHLRAARRAGLAVITVLAAALWLSRSDIPEQPAVRAAAPDSRSAPVLVQSLSDEELLGLFPDTPVGLVTLSDGRKRLVFPREGDEKLHITRL